MLRKGLENVAPLRSPKLVSNTFWARKSILPWKSRATTSRTCSAPYMNSQCAVMASTPRSFCASTMS